MDNIRCRARLSLLWVLLPILGALWLGLAYMFSGAIESVIAGKYFGEQINDALMMLIFMPFALIPMIMAVLCFSLKDKTNRWVNFIMAILFVAFTVLSAFDSSEGELPVITWTFDIVSIVIPVLIAWFAWKLPKQQA